jgi:superfamily II DNA/RNA helicase
MNEKKTFLSLGISPDLIEKIAFHEITEPTAVQTQAIPAVASGESVLFQSETGTGKTLAYLLPLVQKIEALENVHKSVLLVIAAPTYELASQIKTQVQIVTSLGAALLIGGTPLKRQVELLKEKPSVVIGGPARLLELYHLKKLRFEDVKTIVLDEVDRLLAPELRDETTDLLRAMKKEVQLVGCSATVSKNTVHILETARIAGGASSSADESDAGGAQTGMTIRTIFLPQEDVLKKRIMHIALYAEQRDKIETLKKLIQAETPPKALVFTSRADQVENIVSKLTYHKIQCAGLHAKTDKVERKAAIDRFRSGKCPILVTSDLSARGLDIPGITHIIQMDLPSDDDFFIHRAGRTARAGKTGTNIVIGDAWEMRKFAALEKKLGLTVYPKVLYGGKLMSPETDKEAENQSSESSLPIRRS